MSQTDEDLEELPLDPEDEHEQEHPQEEQEEELHQGEEGGEEEKRREEEEGEEIGAVEKTKEAAEEGKKDDKEGIVEEEEEEEVTYLAEDLLSTPSLSKKGTLPIDILEFDYSYGFNCKKYLNMIVLDEDTLLYATGNFLVFFHIPTREPEFRRSYLGGGIGHIRKNPNPEYPHFAVAESGRRPVIIIYTWPDMEVVCVLRGGASRIYTNLDFSPDGELLVSQGGEPDFLITVWNWREHKILLRSKSYVHEVFRVKFSPYVPGQLTSCGLSHIKFWKMAHTFTGLKLKGELGRFGKTEYTDIFGVLPMPDEKVISGCSWGNMLVWDAGLITLEVFRTSRRTCHDAPIIQFFYDETEGELWSVSMDGHVRVWWYEKIDQADPPDNDRIVQIDPSYDFYTPGVMLMCAEKRHPQVRVQDDGLFYAQDGNGGLWMIDLNTERDPKPSVQLYKCHAGEIADIAACSYGSYLATLGIDGKLFLFQYTRQKRVAEYEFPVKGSCLIWLPIKDVPTGDIVIAGFDDGQVRVCAINPTRKKSAIKIVQIIKPHNKPITKIAVNPTGQVLVSSSENKTIFIFKLAANDTNGDILVPIGFIPTPDVVTCITWNPSDDLTVLVGCMQGHMMEVQVPSDTQTYTTTSFLLHLEPKCNRFQSYKSQILRNIKIKQIEAKKAEKINKKMKELEKIKKENPGYEVDEEAFLVDSESEEELEPLFFPEVPNPILWLMYTVDETIWISMAGYDAGYIYEFSIDQKEEVPLKYQMVYDADDTEINSYVYSHNKNFLIFGMEDGSIRINRVNHEDFHDLSDYWIFPMHDNQNGFISKMCFSYDEKYFFSCGSDGNIFAYRFQPDEGYVFPTTDSVIGKRSFSVVVKDVDTYAKLSLEDAKIKAENDRILKLANEHKGKIRLQIKQLRERYSKVLLRNSKLLPSQIISKEDLELDKRVTENVDSTLGSKLELVKRQLAYDVEKSQVQMNKLLEYFIHPADFSPDRLNGINNPDLYVLTSKQRKTSKEFFEVMNIIEQKLIEEGGKGRSI